MILLPNVDRLGVQSLWTPNSFVNEITEEGFRSQPIIAGTLTDDTLTPDDVANIRRSTSDGGFIGSLVSRDQTAAMITAEINEIGRGRQEDRLRGVQPHAGKAAAPALRGRRTMKSRSSASPSRSATSPTARVRCWCSARVALLLTALAVYWYCHSVRFTILPIMCSLTSLVWQFGALRLLGYGLDPLGGAGALPRVRDRRIARRAADQLHRCASSVTARSRWRRPRQLFGPARSRHAGAAHRVRLVRHAAAAYPFR